MKINFKIRKYLDSDFKEVHSIFNQFALESFAAYCETELDIDRMRRMIDQAKAALVIEENKKVVGFGFISEFKPYQNFSRTGVLTYFIKPEFTGKGIGSKLLTELFSLGKKKGITNYLAQISSKNKQSLNFHKKLGFKKVGRFKDVGTKFGQSIDVVWVQKILD